jgi:hypothetical protein
MKAALLDFILDIATSLLTHITKHLGEDPLKGIIAHLTTGWAIGLLHRLIAIVADIEGGAIKVTRVLCGIAIATTKLHHIVL